jgi:phosphatidylinositol alpha-1,6-mannosyltransferase
MLALFSFDYAPLDGGIARLCTQLSGALAAQGCKVRVLTGAAHGPQAEGIVRLNGRRLGREARALRELRRLPKDVGVLCGRWYPEGALALLAGRRRVFVLAHGAELLPASKLRRAVGWQALRRHVLQAVTSVVANSTYTKQLALTEAPLARVTALPLGVDPTFFSPGDREVARQVLGIEQPFVVSTVSRLQAFKGHDTVLRALALLPKAVQRQLAYVVVGRGPYGPTILELATRLGVQGSLLLTGLVSDERLRDVYRASNLFCLLTRATAHAVEGFGLALLEAQSCGVPVLGTRTGGIPDAVADGDTGWLIGQDEPEAVAGHLQRLVADPAAYEVVGAAGRSRAENVCSWRGYAQRLLAEVAC